ncbi:UNVERIFIED_CONTAM: hypothetical protein GTU68_031859 [Idotea baltica]|nr:hypothetical protein [Idotea baltica]
MEHFPSIMTSYETALMLERMIAHFNEWGYGLWAAELKETKECIGFIGLSHPRFENEMTPCVEIGWRLKYEYWGKGLATEGAKEVLRYAFEDLDISHLNSWTAIPNKGSERVMQKIGMKYKGTFLHPNLPPNDPLCEHVIYSITQQEYRVFS